MTNDSHRPFFLIRLYRFFCNLLPWTLADKATLQEEKRSNDYAISLLKENNDKMKQENSEREALVNSLMRQQERINKEHAIVKSEIMGEARLTMRSMRRANALIGLFFFSLITALVLAIIGSRK